MAEAKRQLQLLRFGDFEVDLRTGELRKAGLKLKFGGQPFQVLSILLERPGDLVTRGELQKRLWPDTFVDVDQNLNTAINKIREVLGDSAESPRFIETLSRRGYRFIGELEPRTPDAAPCGSNGDRNPGQMRLETAAPSPALAGNVADAETRNEKSKEASRKRFRTWLVSVVAVIVLFALGAGSYFYFHRTPKLTDKDTIVLADFTNRTEDAVFDGTLREGLSVQLEQSPFLSIISDQQSLQTLQMMGQNPDVKITPQIARELCQRTGSAAVVNGSIAEIGTRYLLTLKAVNCVSGESLASAKAQATDKNNVLDALGKTASEIRRKLGESLSTVEKFNTPLEQATTPSLEALEAYTMGRKMYRGKGEHAAALPFLQRAIMLDHNFAIAYAALGTVYAINGETSLSIENLKKAYELRQSVSEQERFYIETHYYDYVTEDIEKSRQEYELWTQTYPRNQVSRNNLGVIYLALDQYSQALLEFRESLSVAPESAHSYSNLLRGYFFVGRLREAERNIRPGGSKAPRFCLVAPLSLSSRFPGERCGRNAATGDLVPGQASIQKTCSCISKLRPQPTPVTHGRLANFPGKRWNSPGAQS